MTLPKRAPHQPTHQLSCLLSNLFFGLLSCLITQGALIGLVCAQAPTTQQLINGDLVFQTSRSRQSEAIKAATRSELTHVGLVWREGGQAFVFEAVNPKTGRVGLTPYAEWAARGVGGKVWGKRLKDRSHALSPQVEARMREVAERFKGRRYDKRFSWGAERLYCSELVYYVYLVGAGRSLGRVEQIADLKLKAPAVRALIKERVGKRLDLSELIITPASLFDDPALELIEGSAP